MTNCYTMAMFDIYVAALNAPWVLVLIPFAIIIMVVLLKFYIKTFREISRLGGVTKSPLMIHLGETINGSTTIRIFGLQRKFMQTNYNYLATVTNVNFWRESLRQWLAIRIEFISLTILGFTFGFLVRLRFAADCSCNTTV